MLQSLRDYPTSAKCFERACKTQEIILGKDHVLTGTGYHVLAKAYTLQGEFEKALSAERVAHEVFTAKVKSFRESIGQKDYWLIVYFYFLSDNHSWVKRIPAQRRVICGLRS